jgi:hypothetical protein
VKRIHIAAVVACALIWTACGSADHASGENGDDSPGRAFSNRTSNVQVEGEGVVTRMLADDLAGSRHQRFVVRLASGQTVLISHNIDIAPRVTELQKGDSSTLLRRVRVERKGRYGPLDAPRPGREARGRLAQTQRADLSVTLLWSFLSGT